MYSRHQLFISSMSLKLIFRVFHIKLFVMKKIVLTAERLEVVYAFLGNLNSYYLTIPRHLIEWQLLDLSAGNILAPHLYQSSLLWGLVSITKLFSVTIWHSFVADTKGQCTSFLLSSESFTELSGSFSCNSYLTETHIYIYNVLYIYIYMNCLE